MRYLPLTGKRNGKTRQIVAYAKVDDVVYDTARLYRWHLRYDGYASYSRGSQKSGTYRVVMLHRFVLELLHPELFPIPHGMVVDHINRNRLDARDENLRVVTHSVNKLNSDFHDNRPSYQDVLPTRECLSEPDVVVSSGITRYLPLTGKREGKTRQIVAHARVDDILFLELSQHSWYLRPDGYAARTTGSARKGTDRVIKLHHVVLQRLHPELFPIPDGFVIDHKNRNRLDNQDLNLQVTTKSVNNTNRNRSTSSSGYRGVTRRSARLTQRGSVVNMPKPWVARLSVDEQRLNLGNFATVEEAARKVNEAFHYYYPDRPIPNPEFELAVNEV